MKYTSSNFPFKMDLRKKPVGPVAGKENKKVTEDDIEKVEHKIHAWKKYNPNVEEFVKRQTTPGTSPYAPKKNPSEKTGNIDEIQSYAAKPK